MRVIPTIFRECISGCIASLPTWDIGGTIKPPAHGAPKFRAELIHGEFATELLDENHEMRGNAMETKLTRAYQPYPAALPRDLPECRHRSSWRAVLFWRRCVFGCEREPVRIFHARGNVAFQGFDVSDFVRVHVSTIRI
jgi:hypothetical protein